MLNSNLKRYKILVKEFLIKLSYFSMKPTSLKLPIGNRLYLDWDEPRGRAVLKCKGQGQLNIKKMWNDLVLNHNPEVVLDIGANYGEIVFNSGYSEFTKRICVFEANPKLIPFLERSASSHPCSKKIEIFSCLVGSETKANVCFHVDAESSGRSSALENNFIRDSLSISTEMKKIDDIIAESIETLLFKVDVEGYEPFVLKGMNEIITNTPNVIGIVEFNSASFRANNISLEEYKLLLTTHFSIYEILKGGETVKFDFEQVGSRNIECDLLLLKRTEH